MTIELLVIKQTPLMPHRPGILPKLLVEVPDRSRRYRRARGDTTMHSTSMSRATATAPLSTALRAARRSSQRARRLRSGGVVAAQSQSREEEDVVKSADASAPQRGSRRALLGGAAFAGVGSALVGLGPSTPSALAIYNKDLDIPITDPEQAIATIYGEASPCARATAGGTCALETGNRACRDAGPGTRRRPPCPRVAF